MIGTPKMYFSLCICNLLSYDHCRIYMILRLIIYKVPRPLFPIQRPWKMQAMTALKFASELYPWSLANLEFKAFISAETCNNTVRLADWF